MKPSQIKPALTHLIERQRPAFIWGPPGCGKSDVVKSVAESMKLELRDVRLSLMDPIDIKGFPVPDVANGQMNWLPASFLPPMMVKKGTKQIPNPSKGLIFLDEMNSAAQAVQAAAYQFILNRKIGDYTLPEGWSIIAAGNRAGDRSVVHAQPAALANRFVHIDFDVDLDDWYSWATEAGVSPVTRAFVRFRPHLLHNFNASTNERAFPTPRSWVFVDDVTSSKLSTDVEYELIKGTVGEGAAAEYLSFSRLAKDLPTVDEILIAPDTAPVPDQPASMYAITTALDSRSSPKTIGRLLTYAERMPTEFQVLFVRSAVLADRSITQTREYIQWITKNQDVLM